jgi:hypothetical protein
MRWMLCLALSVGAFGQNTLTPQEASDGWLLLFDGRTMFGWTPTGETGWRVQGGAIIADSGGNGWLRHNAEFADFALSCDFRTASDGNSGLFLRSAREGQPHVTGYELQIFDNQPAGFHTGALVNHIKPQKASKIKHNQWMTYVVEAQGPRWIVKLDGETVLTGEDRKSLTGHIGLQFNVGKKIEFRNIKVKPLGVKPMFNGTDMTGWKKWSPEGTTQPPEWSLREGAVHAENGPGQLESEKLYADFILQLDGRVMALPGGRKGDSGIFVRGESGKRFPGYESQIYNGYDDGDRTLAQNFGTGGLYPFFAARRVLGNDGEYFNMTFLARGRHLATWVNGYPVAEYDDPRPEGASMREGALLKPGPIVLQSLGPGSKTDFRNVRISEYPSK